MFLYIDIRNEIRSSINKAINNNGGGGHDHNNTNIIIIITTIIIIIIIINNNNDNDNDLFKDAHMYRCRVHLMSHVKSFCCLRKLDVQIVQRICPRTPLGNSMELGLPLLQST
jgi:hypothetical protein